MTTQHEKHAAIVRGRKFLEKLCDPGRTPRVPSAVRSEARDLLKNYPFDADLHFLQIGTAHIEKTVSPQYNGTLTK